MKLNDALVKVDNGLEALLRKIEKQGTDLNADMDFKVETVEGKSKRCNLYRG